MSGIHLYLSNRQEVLVEKLAGLVSRPLRSPFAPEIIVVQSKGMERWIAMRLAEIGGIAANLSFPFPVAFTFDIFKRLFPDLPENDLFDKTVMTWRIAEKLPGLLDRPHFAPVGRYLADSLDRKFIQLAERLAFVFDQYLIFRPEMILAWDRGETLTETDHELWQADLWRAISAPGPAKHRAGLKEAWSQQLRSGLMGKDFPERVSFFGVSSLPPYYLDFLQQLAPHCPVHFFFLNPCRQYWADIFREERALRKKNIVPPPGDGNGLLTSLGELGGDFLHTVYSQDLNPLEDDDYEDPGHFSLLSSIQSDILDQTTPLQDGQQRAIAPHDRSIRIHSCHSPMREMEVLRDEILDLLEHHPDIEPRDIVVMTPDIETYAPYIQAVFDVPATGSVRLPFSIADRDQGQVSPVARTFLEILELAGSKLTASQVVSILESPPVMEKFEFNQDDLELFRYWIEKTGIKWGMDPDHRQRLDLPPFSENTWQAGLDRLLLGYALSDEEEQLFKSILPLNVEGDAARALGQLLSAVDALFSRIGALDAKRTLLEWQDVLLDLVSAVFETEADFARECSDLRRAVSQLAEEGDTAGFTGNIGLQAIRHILRNRLKEQGQGRRFMTGGITFCSMLPMRTIPFAVVALVGLEHDSFPRRDRPQEFNLMNDSPRPGDRSRRLDDRYLFLEALLAARRFLCITYRGQNIDDNATVPPSVLVSELLDYIRDNYRLEPGTDARMPAAETLAEHVLVLHRLQAFHPDYYGAERRLFSYSRDNCSAARALAGPSREARFFAEPLALPGEEWQDVALDDLTAFLVHPANFLLKRRMGFTPASRYRLLTDEEPLASLDPLTRYTLGQRITRRILSDTDQDGYQLARAGQHLPPGTMGDVVYEQLHGDADRLARSVDLHAGQPAPEPLDFELPLGGFRLHGRLTQQTPGPVRYRFAKLKGKDLLAAWPEHLVLSVLDGERARTTLIGLEGNVWRLRPVAQAGEVLLDLLQLLQEGLRRPLPLFAESSLAYAQTLLGNGKEHSAAMTAARRKWQGYPPVPGEGEDPAIRLCFRGMRPLEDEFSELARRVFAPLLQNWIQD